MAVQTEDAAKHPTSARWHIRSLRCVTVRLGYSQNDGATISWSVERLLEGFDMSRRPLLFCRDAILLAACRAAPAFNSPCRRSQTLRRDAALVSRPKEQATRPRVLLWVKLRRTQYEHMFSALPRTRTLFDAVGMSQTCQRTKPLAR